MNRLLFFLVGMVVLPAFSWLALVELPRLQLDAVTPSAAPLSALAAQGGRVYAAENCAVCHTEQAAPGDRAALDRNWVRRPTVPNDFRSAYPAMPGLLRIGPDLSDVGHRLSAVSLAQILYTPPAGMPSYRFLFEPAQPGGEIVATPQGAALLAYLLALEQTLPAPASAPAAP